MCKLSLYKQHAHHRRHHADVPAPSNHESDFEETTLVSETHVASSELARGVCTKFGV